MAIDQRAHVRIACGAFAAALLCSVSTVALAGPRHAPRAPAVSQAQVDQIMSELQNERAAREAAEARLQALTDRLAALEQTTQTVASNSDSQTATVADLSSTVTTLNLLPRASVNNGRMTVATQDNKFSASMRGIVMLDTAYYNQSSPGPIATDLRRGAGTGDTAHARDLNSGTNFRRARFGIEGRVFTDFTYSMIYEFGGSGAEDAGHVFELYAQYNGIPHTYFRVGAFEPQVGLGANISTTGMPLMERPSGAEITRNIAAGDSRSAVQVTHWGDIGGDTGLSALYMVSAAYTGSSASTVNSTGGFASQPFGEQSSIVGRATIAPVSGTDWMAHFGVAGSYVFRPANATGPDSTGVNPTGAFPVQFRDRPELRNDTTRLVDTGGIDASHAWHYGFEGAFQHANFLIDGEYFGFGLDRRNSTLANPRFSGWYIEGSWMITGEQRRYNATNAEFDGPSPQYAWVPGSGGYGAWELAARYSTVDLNYRAGAAGTAPAADAVRGGQQDVWTVGLNWFVNNNIKFMLDFQDVRVDRLSPNAATFSTPIGAQIGQHYQAVAIRSQIGF